MDMAITPQDELIVIEQFGRRLQWFTLDGKSKKILKMNAHTYWIGLTSANQLVTYLPFETFETRRLFSIRDYNEKILKRIGTYHDRSKDHKASEKLRFSIDDKDNVYVANYNTPVIRKYSCSGQLLLVITFEPPFRIPVKISLDENGDEIKRIEEIKYNARARKRSKRKGGIIYTESDIHRYPVCFFTSLDTNQRLYMATYSRNPKDINYRGASVEGSPNKIKIKGRGKAQNEKVDFFRILVFDPGGKVIAEAPITHMCNDIYIKGNRLFLMDTFINLQVLEYEIHIGE